jgi:hypothetical protein
LANPRGATEKSKSCVGRRDAVWTPEPLVRRCVQPVFRHGDVDARRHVFVVAVIVVVDMSHPITPPYCPRSFPTNPVPGPPRGEAFSFVVEMTNVDYAGLLASAHADRAYCGMTFILIYKEMA